MSTNPNVLVQTVEPLYLQLNLEEKQSKKVPVISNVNVDFAKQYGFFTKPEIIPDSITVSGATSRVENIDRWPTEVLKLNRINKSISTEVALIEPPSLIRLSQEQVQYRAEVAEYTEAEITVPVETRDFPAGLNVTFSPLSVDIKYQIPLKEYAALKNSRPFAAYVTYSQIKQDTSGFVEPQVDELLEKNYLNVRKITPSKVAYFTIIRN